MSKKQRILRNNKGLTLIELVIAAGLLLIVISLGYTLLFFGMRSFDTGTAQAHTQQNVRLAGDYLRSELRNALDISISNEDLVDLVDGYKHGEYYKFYLDDGSFVRKEVTIDDQNNNNNVDYGDQTVITDVIIEEIELTFSGSILKFEITAEFDDAIYSYKDQVFLNNWSPNEDFTTIIEKENGYYVFYEKP